MTRETRLVAILIAVSAVGVASLAFMADQYRKHLAPNPAAARAAREVAGFLAAREAVRSVCAREGVKVEEVAAAVAGSYAGVEDRLMGPGLDVIARYRTERFNAFAAHGMRYADYVAARTAWRAWSASERGGDPALTAAFEERRAAAEKAGLGELEALDDAIK